MLASTVDCAATGSVRTDVRVETARDAIARQQWANHGYAVALLDDVRHFPLAAGMESTYRVIGDAKHTPTTVAWGVCDKSFPTDVVVTINTWIPHARLAPIRGAGPFAHLSQPGAVADAIAAACAEAENGQSSSLDQLPGRCQREKATVATGCTARCPPSSPAPHIDDRSGGSG